MSYLTYQEYRDLKFNKVDEETFNELVRPAEDAIDAITRHFYQFHDLDSDNKFRQTQFKKAISVQIEYFDDMGATSMHEINTPLNVRIGRTQVSTGSSNQRQPNSQSNNAISGDAISYLRSTGLLYRGVGVV